MAFAFSCCVPLTVKETVEGVTASEATVRDDPEDDPESDSEPLRDKPVPQQTEKRRRTTRAERADDLYDDMFR